MAVNLFQDSQVDVLWTGTLREKVTGHGRFRRNHPKRVPVAVAMKLVMQCPGFQIIGKNPTGFLGLVAKQGARIAVVRNAGLGDVLSTVFFLANPMTRAHPQTTVDLFTTSPFIPLMRLIPFISSVYPMPGDLSKYDASVNVCWKPEREDPRNERNRPEIFAEPIGDLADFIYDFWKFPSELQEKAKDLLHQQGWKDDRPLIGFQITSASPIRTYPITYLGDLLTLLINEGFDVVVFGLDIWGYQLKQWKGEHLFNFVDNYTLVDVAAVSSVCNAFLAPDSGLLHLASVMGIPTLGLFGNINPQNRIKYYPLAEALYPENELACIPCGDVHNPCPECSNLGGTKFSGKCMHLLTPERVFDTFLDFLERHLDITRRVSLVKDILCPFCGSKGELANTIQGKWYKEYYPDRVRFFRCVNCNSIFADPGLKSIAYEENYWTKDPEMYAGTYFLPEHDKIHLGMFQKVRNLFQEAIS